MDAEDARRCAHLLSKAELNADIGGKLKTPPPPRPNPDGLVFKIRNVHVADCGHPPNIEIDKTDPAIYSSYYENPYGDQFVVLIDREEKLGVVWGGDICWTNPVCIEDDTIQGDRIKDHTIFSRLEFEWLSLCWKTATRRRLQWGFNFQEELRKAGVQIVGDTPGE